MPDDQPRRVGIGGVGRVKLLPHAQDRGVGVVSGEKRVLEHGSGLCPLCGGAERKRSPSPRPRSRERRRRRPSRESEPRTAGYPRRGSVFKALLRQSSSKRPEGPSTKAPAQGRAYHNTKHGILRGRGASERGSAHDPPQRRLHDRPRLGRHAEHDRLAVDALGGMVERVGGAAAAHHRRVGAPHHRLDHPRPQVEPLRNVLARRLPRPRLGLLPDAVQFGLKPRPGALRKVQFPASWRSWPARRSPPERNRGQRSPVGRC